MRDIPRYSVILTHNRPEMLADTITDIRPQCDWLIVVDNASDPPALDSGEYLDSRRPGDAVVLVVRDPLQPPNLATLWNSHLEQVTEHAQQLGYDRWDVALLCDDLDIPPDWYDRVSAALRGNNASAASTGPVYPSAQPLIKYRPDGDIMTRLHGACFVLAGEKGIRADESMHWWWVDTDIDWQARLVDGVVIAPGPVATNRLPNDWTNRKPELGAQAGRDRQAFAAKWGSAPW